MKNIVILFLTTAVLTSFPGVLHAAVGCDLNDPDRDVRRLFPGSTSYKTNYISIDKKGGSVLLRQIEKRLGDKFKGLYETIDVPYTVYEIFRGKKKIGYIHGINQKGTYGGIQVFLCLNMKGNIRNFYFQRLTSRKAARLRSRSFGAQFIGLNLGNFYNYDVALKKATGRVAGIRNPAPGARPDFYSTLRAVKKNLIIMDEFFFGNMYLKFFK